MDRFNSMSSSEKKMINFLNCSQFFLRFLLNSTQTMLLFFFYYYYSKYYSSYQFPRENFSKYEISILKSSSRRSFIPNFCFISKRDESQERNDEGSKLQTCRSFFKATRVVAIFGGVYSSRKGEGEGGGFIVRARSLEIEVAVPRYA